MKKRGQISIFIILGIIILFAAGLFFYLRQRTTVFEPTLVVPQEVIPVQRHIENCLYGRAAEGLQIMGSQGGYINVPEAILRARPGYIQRGPNILPHWFYKGRNRIPTIAQMEQELQEYVNASVEECTDLSSFSNQFDFEEVERARNIVKEVRVQIQEDDVLVELDHPLIAKDKQTEKQTNLLRFPVRVPVRIRKMHELASNVLNMETFTHFFEKTTINLMSIQPEIPFTSLELKCGALTWRLDEIQDLLQEMLVYNLNRVRVKNTDYEDFEDSEFDYESLRDLEKDENGAFVNPLPDNIPSDTYDYFQLFMDAELDDTRYKDFKMKFRYDPSFGMDLFGNPSKDGLLKSNYGQGPREFMQFFCINMYHFTYDLDYPIEARVIDPLSFNGQGYTFKFAFPVTIRSNRPEKSDQPPSFIEPPLALDPQEYCGALAPDPITVKVRGISEDGFFEPLENVNISFQCINRLCRLGQTATQPLGELREFPPAGCINPFIIAEKPGYITRVEQMLDPEGIEMELDKAKAFTWDVVKHPYFSSRIIPELTQTGNELSGADSVQVNIEYKGDDPNNKFRQTDIYPNEDNSTLWLAESDGTYKIDLMYFKSGAYIGGYTVTNLTISAGEIASGNHVTFHAVDFKPTPVGRNEESFIDMVIYLGEQSYKEDLRPTFSTR